MCSIFTLGQWTNRVHIPRCFLDKIGQTVDIFTCGRVLLHRTQQAKPFFFARCRTCGPSDTPLHSFFFQHVGERERFKGGTMVCPILSTMHHAPLPVFVHYCPRFCPNGAAAYSSRKPPWSLPARENTHARFRRRNTRVNPMLSIALYFAFR